MTLNVPVVRASGSAMNAGVKTKAELHLGIAENGKLLALKGDHTGALLHYREAMRIAIEEGSSPIFARHYMECSLESLEHMGALVELLEYTSRAIAHYAENPPESAAAKLDLATLHERRGAVLLKAGKTKEARGAFEQAISTARAIGRSMPLSETLQKWVLAGYHVDAQKVLSEQKRRNAFLVRPGAVSADRAIALPSTPALAR